MSYTEKKDLISFAVGFRPTTGGLANGKEAELI